MIGKVVDASCRLSEPGIVEAWQDNVHEQGTREYGNGSMKSGFRQLAYYWTEMAGDAVRNQVGWNRGSIC